MAKLLQRSCMNKIIVSGLTFSMKHLNRMLFRCQQNLNNSRFISAFCNFIWTFLFILCHKPLQNTLFLTVRMHNKLPFLLLTFLFITMPLFGQTDLQKQQDSLERRLEQIISPEDRVLVLTQLSMLYADNDEAKCLEFSNELLRLARKEKNTYAQSVALRFLGTTYMTLGDPEQALDNLVQAKQVLEADKDSSLLPIVYYDIATLLVDRGDQDAQVYFKKAIKIEKEVGVNINLPGFLMGYASYFQSKKDFARSFELYDEAIAAVRKTDNHRMALPVIFVNLAQAHVEKGDEKESYRYCDSAFAYLDDYTPDAITSGIYEAYGEALCNFGKYDRALPYLNKAAEFSLQGEELVDNLKYRIECLKKTGNNAMAFSLMEEYVRLKDSLTTLKSNDDYERYMVLFKTNEAQQDLAIQKKDSQLQAQKIELLEGEQAEQYYLFFLILMLTVLLAFTIVLLIQRHRRKVNKLNQAIEHRDVELTNYALTIVEKNNVLQAVKEEFERMKKEGNEASFGSDEVSAVMLNIRNPELHEKLSHIEQSFQFKLSEKYPSLSEREKKVCSLIKLDFSSKEIGELLNVSPRSVDTYRYRIRKKMELNTSDSLIRAIKQL